MPDLPLDLLRRGVSSGFGQQTAQSVQRAGIRSEALPSTGGGSFTTSVERIGSTNEATPWSVILKRMVTGNDGWDREVDAHLDANWFTDALPSGLHVPRLLAMDRSAEHADLVIEDLGPSAPIDEADLIRTSGLLARFSASSAPPRPWWSSGVLATEFRTLGDRPERLVDRRDDVRFERLRQQLIELHADAPRLLKVAHRSPLCPAHLDAYSRNVIIDCNSQRIGLVDWAHAGAAPIGTDPATLFALTLDYLDIDTDSLPDLETSMIDALVAGLGDGTASPAVDTVIASFQAVARLRHLAMMMNALPMVEAADPAVSTIVGRPLEEIVDRWITIGGHLTT